MRFHATAEGNIPFTAQEEAEADIREAEWLAQQPQRDRAKAKEARQAAVDAITVTTSTGKPFDGNETAQGRMSRAIIGLQAANVPTIIWTLSDNTSVEVTLSELTEALILAGQEQARLWVI